MAAWYINSGGTLTLKLFKLATQGASTEIAAKPLVQTGFVALPEKVTKSISGPDAIIDNRSNGYWVQFCATNGVNSFLYNVRITYTYQNAGD